MKIKKKSLIQLKKKKENNRDLTIQWTIRGISLEARSAAQKAAEKKNEFIGSWISRKLLEAARADLTTKQEVVRHEDVQDILTKMQSSFFDEMTKMSAKIDSFSSKRSFLSKLMRK